MIFNQVIGQQEAKERLLQLVEEQRLPHALMLCGPMGSGKMALAMAFAAYLLGDRRQETGDRRQETGGDAGEMGAS